MPSVATARSLTSVASPDRPEPVAEPACISTQAAPSKRRAKSWRVPLESSIQTAAGWPLTSNSRASSAEAVALIPVAPSEPPSATQSPMPPAAAGSKRPARISLPDAVISVQATTGSPEASSVNAGRRDSPAVSLTPPCSALAATVSQPEAE